MHCGGLGGVGLFVVGVPETQEGVGGSRGSVGRIVGVVVTSARMELAQALAGDTSRALSLVSVFIAEPEAAQ